MALAKDQQIPRDSSMGSKVQSCVFNDNSAMDITLLRTNNGIVNEYHKSVLEDEDGGSQSTNGYSNDSAITHSPPLCGDGYTYKSTSYQIEEEQSLINFKASDIGGFSNLIQGSESLLSFQQNSYMKDNSHNDYCVWENNLHHQGYDNNQWNQISPRNTSEIRLMQDFGCFQSASSSYGSIVNNAKEKQHGESSYGWLYSEPIVPASDSIKESSSGAQEIALKKRVSTADQNMKGAKKQCSTESKTPKPKSGPSKDPQSVAAKNRRERISERLKILQELVPNGSKVDLVTMLEKAISYVKFLQLQVKVLATDEFWPVQGGKAPDVSQVKEAIDAILSSQRDRISSSKVEK